ncbi:MAG: DinB family protein [Gemmatimonadota bacterium]|nr:DinB family protein [Gemmatimonadota bacterium]
MTDNLLQRSAGFVLLREIESVRSSIEAYPSDESLWAPVPGITNTGGTLALHIAGNLRHFLGNFLGGVPFTRDREAEFSNRSATRADLVALIEETRKAIAASIPKLSNVVLARPFPLQIVGRTVGTADFVVHLASHLAYHLGQMDYHRRIVTGEAAVVPALEVSKIPGYKTAD